MTSTLRIDFPTTLALHAKNREAMEQRGRFLMALKYFELGELSSGQAAAMCDMRRVAFLTEASKCGVPVADLDDEELKSEFADG